MDILNRGLGVEKLLDWHDLTQGVEGVPVLLAVEHRQLVATPRIPKGDPDEETVELSLGERVCPLILDRILGRENDERRWQRMSYPVDGDLCLLHRLQQRCLRLRRCPVDLIRQDHLPEDRPGSELKPGRARIKDTDPANITGQQVGRELNALEAAADAPRDG